MFKRKDKGKRFKVWLIVAVCLVIAVSGAWLFFTRFEGEKPKIKLNPREWFLAAESEISGVVKDQKSGLKKLWIGLLKNGHEIVLLKKDFTPRESIPGGCLNRAPFKLNINTKKLKIADGKATLIVTVWDNSWRNWWEGNRTYIEKDIVFDTKPPSLSVLSSRHNVSQGGSGLVIYRLSEPCPASGVYVGDDFFPGHAGFFKDPDIYLAFFAVRYDQGPGTDLYVQAVDQAGNSSRHGFYHHILKKRYKHDIINISDAFLNWKLPEFQGVEGWNDAASQTDKFLFINRTLRRQNNETILKNGRKTQAGILWSGDFGRLPNSARRAGFADHRVYKYHGTRIDNAVHMGIDLASVRHAEVPAANNGRVVYVGKDGIYGNIVCIDHGFGLFSLYAHLSRVVVEPGTVVKKGMIIGYTGTTGLAGGDHLHFGMFIDHVFVNPVEWWDAAWIRNNITAKIKNVQSVVK